MPIPTGVDAQIGYVAETAYGAAGTPSRFLYLLQEALSAEVRHIISRGLQRTAPQNKTRTVPWGAGGSVQHDIATNGFGLLLQQMLGGLAIAWPGGTASTVTLTIGDQVTDGDTMTLDTKVYTFKDTLTQADGEITIGADVAATKGNIVAAITLGAGMGTAYGSAMTEHPTVRAAPFVAAAGAMTAKTEGDAGDAIVSTETFTSVANIFSGATLSGGADGTDTRYSMTATPHAHALRHRSLHTQVGKPDVHGVLQPFNYLGCKVSGWKIACELEGNLRLSLDLDIRELETRTVIATASFADAAVFVFDQFAVTLGGTAIPVRSFRVRGTNGMDSDRRFLGSGLKSEPRDTVLDVTAELDPEFENLDRLTDFLAGTDRQLIITGTGELIPSSVSPYLFKITIPDMRLEGDATPQVGGPDVVRQPNALVAFDDGTHPLISIQYDTDDAAA